MHISYAQSHTQNKKILTMMSSSWSQCWLQFRHIKDAQRRSTTAHDDEKRLCMQKPTPVDVHKWQNQSLQLSKPISIQQAENFTRTIKSYLPCFLEWLEEGAFPAPAFLRLYLLEKCLDWFHGGLEPEKFLLSIIKLRDLKIPQT